MIKHPKYLILSLLIGIASINYSNAQWTSSFSGPDLSFDHPFVWNLSVVDSNVVWANIAQGFLQSLSSNDFLRTTDGGQTWERGFTPEGSSMGYNINLFALDSLTAWVSRLRLPNEDRTTIYKTEDGGISWEAIDFPFSNDFVAVVAIHFLNQTDGFAYAETHDGTDWHVESYYTDDGGETWKLATTPYLAGERIFIWHGNNNYAVQGDTIWFGTSLSRLFRSIDKGVNWEALTLPFYHTRPAESVAFQDANNGMVATALSDSLGGTLAYNEALHTTDGGDTWTHIPIPNDIYFDPRLVGLCAIPGSNGVYMLYGYRQDDFKYQQMITSDNGLTWHYVEGPESKARCIQFISPSLGWGGGWNYYQTGTVEKVYKWSGPPLTLEGVSSANEWNRLQTAVELWPNPAVDKATLKIKGLKDEDFKIEIFDISGKQVLSSTQRGNSSQTIRIGHWDKGTYITKISTAEGMTARILIKQ